MCLAVPGKVRRIHGRYATVDIQGNERQVGIAFVPEVKVGDHVLVHAGYAIQIIDEAEAAETLRLLEELLEHVP